jgi:hypothetical protein
LIIGLGKNVSNNGKDLTINFIDNRIGIQNQPDDKLLSMQVSAI